MESINVELGYMQYPIVFSGSFNDLSKVYNKYVSSKNVLVVTDSNVDRMIKIFSNVFLNKYVISPGEKSKSLSTIKNIYKKCLELELDRDACIIALGGGVVGDIAGFVAATYMRGINFVQLPTSLLAQVDSSVGGKTGVDFKGFKNIIGSFYQPKMVYINTETLKTLPKREFTSGMVEVIKYAIIKDKELYRYLDENAEDIIELKDENILHIIKTCCKIKTEIVSQDEKDKGIRAILNFGHTIGHAIESASNFRLLHGESIALGMVAASKLSLKRKILNQKEYKKIIKILEKYNIATGFERANINKILLNMKKDKKREHDKLKFILPKSIGEVEQVNDVTEEEIVSVLNEMIG